MSISSEVVSDRELRHVRNCHLKMIKNLPGTTVWHRLRASFCSERYAPAGKKAVLDAGSAEDTGRTSSLTLHNDKPGGIAGSHQHQDSILH